MSQVSKDPAVAKMEQQLNKLVLQVEELNRRISFLERENNRRKSEVSQIANKKG